MLMVDFEKATKNFESYLKAQGEENHEKDKLVELNNEAVQTSKECIGTLGLILEEKDFTDEESKSISDLLEGLIDVTMCMQTTRMLISFLYGEDGDANDKKRA